MSRSLTIDTSTSHTIVGLIEDGQILFQSHHEGATDHGAAVMELVAQAINAGGVPSQVIVGMGPGPFTGLRVGIAFARAYALARDIPVIGICSLDAIDIDQSEYTVAIDARRKEQQYAFAGGGVSHDVRRERSRIPIEFSIGAPVRLILAIAEERHAPLLGRVAHVPQKRVNQ